MVALIHGSSICSMRLGSGNRPDCAAYLARIIGAAGAQLDAIDHRGRGGDEIKIIFAAEALLDDFQMQQAKPQRKPKPSAAEVSISKLKLASLRRSLAMLSRSFSKSAASTGNSPQNTTGCTSL
jgi:hypothetical protein